MYTTSAAAFARCFSFDQFGARRRRRQRRLYDPTPEKRALITDLAGVARSQSVCALRRKQITLPLGLHISLSAAVAALSSVKFEERERAKRSAWRPFNDRARLQWRGTSHVGARRALGSADEAAASDVASARRSPTGHQAHECGARMCVRARASVQVDASFAQRHTRARRECAASLALPLTWRLYKARTSRVAAASLL